MAQPPAGPYTREKDFAYFGPFKVGPTAGEETHSQAQRMTKEPVRQHNKSKLPFTPYPPTRHTQKKPNA